MKTKLMFTTTMLLISNFVLAESFNTYQASYGVWGKSGDNAESMKITTQGMDDIVKAPVKCKKKPNWGHEIDWVGGSELRKSILESIDDVGSVEDDKSAKEYKNEMQPVLEKLQNNKKYFRIIGFLSCGDGSSGFIHIDGNMGLRIDTAPDDFYSVVYKK